MEKQCRIKTGVVQRLEKELQRYQEEVATQAAKVEAMRAAEADEHDVKKQIEVLGEAEMMVPDSARRLQKAVEDLQEFMVSAEYASCKEMRRLLFNCSDLTFGASSLLGFVFASSLVAQDANRGAADLAASAHREAAEAALARHSAAASGEAAAAGGAGADDAI